MDPFSSLTFGQSLSVRVDGAIGAMSLSPNGRDAVLAGRRGLFIIDLEDPFTTPRWLHHITSWEVADVQWSPHKSKPSWCISTSNQKALLWDLARPSNNAIANVLHHHTRAITDINFHPYDPELLATCSIDTFVLRWDMRTPRKPVAKWAEWRAGATQVKWNHSNPWEVASSHDNGFCVWDSRKDALPVVKVPNAHGGKINGLDFSLGISSFVTCSNDKEVKFWNLNGNLPYAPSVVISADYPVARARPLPFGRERVVGLMPLRGGDDAVHIVNYDSLHHASIDTGATQYIQADPAYSFKGHSAPVKDFLWRTRHEAYNGIAHSNRWKDYQLVTWGQDYDLKLWPQDDNIYGAANYNPTYQRILGAIGEVDDFSVSPANSSGVSQSQSPKAVSPAEEKPPLNDKVLAYDTYCVEPPVALQDLIKKNNGDKLSALTLLELYKRNINGGSNTAAATNNLDWISGVRMGHAGHGSNRDQNGGPLNLGEEVSYVGHKFPKVRFERIFVSTGDVVLSLVGPVTRKQRAGHRKSVSEKSTEATEKAEAPEETETVNTNPEDNAPPAAQTNGEPPGDPATEVEEVTELVFIRVKIKFPKGYPYLEAAENPPSSLSSSKRAAYVAEHFVSFSIEETHELSKTTASEMVEQLSSIAYFYTNKYHKFCLEPCLRLLMGDKVDLEDLNFETALNEDEEFVQEIGNEGWADDLINQQPEQASGNQMFEDGESSGEDMDEFDDLIPIGRDLAASQGSFPSVPIESGENNNIVNNKHYDSTPLPKGCGALWSHTGQLVCFFVPKKTDDDESKNFQKFNIFKFTDGELSVRNRQHESMSQTIRLNTLGDLLSSDEDLDSEGPDDILDHDDSSSETSDDSNFSQDWLDIMEDETRNVARIPPLFQTSLGLGNRYAADQKNSVKRLASKGDGSVNKASLHDSIITPSSRKGKKHRKNTNIVGVFDFSHLLPDKYDLACRYRILGDLPDVLAKYNSEVASSYGFEELAEVWNILAILLLNSGASSDRGYFYNWDNEAIRGINDDQRSFYWGNHPFGYRGLIKHIFEYFERRGSIQTLVTMSCVMYERANHISNIDPGNSPEVMKSRSLPYTPLLKQLPMEGNSVDHRTNESGSYLMSPLLNTPVPLSVSSSPRPYEMSINSSLGSSFKESFSESSMMKRGHSFNFSEDTKGRDDFLKRNQYNNSRMENKTDYSTQNIVGGSTVNVEMCNVDELELFESRNSGTLIDLRDMEKIRLYREHYADMLFLWRLPVNRILVLKFNYPDVETQEGSSSFDIHRLKVGLRDENLGNIGEKTSCLISPSGTVPLAKSQTWHEVNEGFKYCQLCNLRVTKWAVVCNICEHTLHADCAASWWTETEGSEEFEECPGGCGCHCLYSL